MMPKSLTQKSLFAALLAFSAVILVQAQAQTDDARLQEILSRDEAPEGVVFEIVTAKDGLRWAIPLIEQQSKALRARFADINIAVVTHGKEMFALESKNSNEYKTVHRQVQSLVQSNIPVHVCGTYAEWKGVHPEDFPDYVDVAPAGPAQVNNYIDLGYELIKLKRPPSTGKAN